MNPVGRIGARVIEDWQQHRSLAAVAAAVVRLGLTPSSWPRTVRGVLARQLLFTGLDAVRFVAMVGAVIGLAVVLQAQLWLTEFGQTAYIGPILVAVIIREAGPLLVNFVVIMRSGTAIASELSVMRVSGEIRVLDSQGLDPLAYLVLPRGVGVALSVFCLTVVFVLVSFLTGYAASLAITPSPGGLALFVDSVARAIAPRDIGNLAAKTLIPGLLTGLICSMEGLSVRGALTDVPQAATRGVVRSVAALFMISIIVSVLTYL